MRWMRRAIDFPFEFTWTRAMRNRLLVTLTWHFPDSPKRARQSHVAYPHTLSEHLVGPDCYLVARACLETVYRQSIDQSIVVPERWDLDSSRTSGQVREFVFTAIARRESIIQPTFMPATLKRVRTIFIFNPTIERWLLSRSSITLSSPPRETLR